VCAPAILRTGANANAAADTITRMHILLVEDEPVLRAQLRAALAAAGYAVDEADNGRDAHFLGDTASFDAVVLDLGLPQLDGLSVLRRWRDAGRTMPVLILTARDNWNEKVAGIDAGADDYLTKPFHMEELLARLRALIRRASGQASPVLHCGELALDTRSGRATLAGQPLALTSHEYRVLAYFMHRPGTVVSRAELTEHIYAQDFERDSNTIEVFVARLRKKLPAGLIETVRGLGYRLVLP
jgi:two-component system OmpR family response regulator